VNDKYSLDKAATFYVAGHKGMVGSAIVRELERLGFSNIIGKTSKELDLKDRGAVFAFFAETNPRYVVLAAAKVGGIFANDTYPAQFLTENLQIQINVMDAALEHGVERLLFMGSSCIYPKFAAQPIKEESLMTGHLESTNDAYAIAKIAGIGQVQAIRKQHGLQWISVMPTNLYGPGDNYSEMGSHVLPALIRRYYLAKQQGLTEVVNWGSGSPFREFLFVDDLAKASVFLMQNYNESLQVNVGTGEDLSIKDLAELIAKEIGFEGTATWDASKPDGTPKKLLDVSLINSLGWKATTALADGLKIAIADYQARLG
jgi:GDP-L-fucose synthase